MVLPIEKNKKTLAKKSKEQREKQKERCEKSLWFNL
jgi:hypothetical protein